ncbi:uncharacterized protein [Penaeus vannamei]|uniref:uncharacterized protein n=1 Tax=Penaeus vannamei TaxID=6689 RepID=UPI00387FA651
MVAAECWSPRCVRRRLEPWEWCSVAQLLPPTQSLSRSGWRHCQTSVCQWLKSRLIRMCELRGLTGKAFARSPTRASGVGRCAGHEDHEMERIGRPGPPSATPRRPFCTARKAGDGGGSGGVGLCSAHALSRLSRPRPTTRRPLSPQPTYTPWIYELHFIVARAGDMSPKSACAAQVSGGGGGGGGGEDRPPRQRPPRYTVKFSLLGIEPSAAPGPRRCRGCDSARGLRASFAVAPASCCCCCRGFSCCCCWTPPLDAAVATQHSGGRTQTPPSSRWYFECVQHLQHSRPGTPSPTPSRRLGPWLGNSELSRPPPVPSCRCTHFLRSGNTRDSNCDVSTFKKENVDKEREREGGKERRSGKMKRKFEMEARCSRRNLDSALGEVLGSAPVIPLYSLTTTSERETERRENK